MTITRPHRASHGHTQRVHASPDRVFPLMCPVREVDWVNGWEPGLVISESGLAEADCIFTTPTDRGDAIWVVTEFEPSDGRIGFVKVTPGETVSRIAIDLEADGPERTLLHVRYTLTSLGDAGSAAVDAFTAEAYAEFMCTWEAALNHYLATGKKLASHQPLR